MNEFNTEKSAIEELECHRDEYNYVMAPGTCDVAIQALEKQVGRKPIHANGNYYCPTCKDTWLLWDDAIPNEYDNFCRYCGQKIDWSEEE